jgi:hypothetical protein
VPEFSARPTALPSVKALEVLFLFLRSRRTASEGALCRSMEDRALSSPGDVNARDSVLGRKKPSLPKGMLRP